MRLLLVEAKDSDGEIKPALKFEDGKIIPMFPVESFTVLGEMELLDNMKINGTMTLIGNLVNQGTAEIRDLDVKNIVLLQNDKAIYGKNTEGLDYELIKANSNNNIIVGYGTFAAGAGSTHVYGNTVRLYSTNAIELRNATSVSGTITAVNSSLVISDISATRGLYIYSPVSQSNVGMVRLSTAGALYIGGNYAGIAGVTIGGKTITEGSGFINFNSGSTTMMVMDRPTGVDYITFRPSTSNNYNLGGSSYRWRNLFLNNSANVSSDRKVKKNIGYTALQNASVLEQFVQAIAPCTYYIKQDDSRRQVGFIAQDVAQALFDAGLPDMDIVGIVDKVTGQEYNYSEVVEQQLPDDALDYSLKYERFVPLILAYLKTEQTKRALLEARIEQLEEKINQLLTKEN